MAKPRSTATRRARKNPRTASDFDDQLVLTIEAIRVRFAAMLEEYSTLAPQVERASILEEEGAPVPPPIRKAVKLYARKYPTGFPYDPPDEVVDAYADRPPRSRAQILAFLRSDAADDNDFLEAIEEAVAERWAELVRRAADSAWEPFRQASIRIAEETGVE